MKVMSKHFGEIEMNDSDLLKFPMGLPGFPGEVMFALLNFDKDELSNFYFLQSVNDKELFFVLLDAMALLSDYDPEINAEDLVTLGEYEQSDLAILNVAVIPDDFYKTTVNLLAPIVINFKTNLCAQVVVNDEYNLKHFLFNQEVCKDGE